MRPYLGKSAGLKNIYEKLCRLHGYTRERPFISMVIEELNKSWDDKNIFVIEAPTGYGKSSITATIALKAYEEGGKLIVSLPMRTLLEDQFDKLKEVLPAAEGVMGKRYMHEHSSPYLIKPITLTTIDTLSLTMFGLAPEDLDKVIKGWRDSLGTIEGTSGHYLFSQSSVICSDIVLDEVHLLSDETKSLTYLLTLLLHAIDYDQKVVLMSATIPQKLKDELRNKLYRYEDKIEWFEFDPSIDDKFLQDRLSKKYEIKLKQLSMKNGWCEEIKGWVSEGWEVGYRRVLVVFNTVHEAITFYEFVKNDFKNVLLLHSRFTESDKKGKHEMLRRLRVEKEYVIVGTQSVEAGIDISSNLLITDLAPAHTLVQRFGRFLRYDGEIEGLAYIWKSDEVSGRRYKVYDEDLCKETYEFIKAHSGELNLHIPTIPDGGAEARYSDYKELIDRVYRLVEIDVDAKEIESMLRAFTNLHSIADAVEKFFEYGGSFIRESPLIPVQVESVSEPIPVSFHTFSKLWKSGRVKGLVKEGKGGVVGEPIGAANLFLRNPRDLIKFIYSEGIRSFIVEGEYSEESGLRITGDAEE
ncbi:MAG: CRISPR-associated helicase Cas3' [Candidatus Bathyarchaeia archaeon]